MTPEPPVSVYIAIGNDTGLSPLQWATYSEKVTEEIIRGGGRILADWYSAPTAHWQGQCLWVEVAPGIVGRVQETLVDVARGFGQPRILWSEVPTAVYLS